MRTIAAVLLACGEALAAPPPLQWDLSDHGPAVVVSAASASRASITGPAWESVRSSTSQSQGVRTVQLAVDALSPGTAVMVGVLNGAADVGGYLGADVNSIGYWSNGNTLSTIGGDVQPASYGEGDTVGVQVNFTAKTVRFQRNGGAWTRTLSIGALGADVYVGASFNVQPAGRASVRIVSDDWNDFSEPTVNVVFAGDSISVTGGVRRTYVARVADMLEASRRARARVQRFAMNGASWDYAWPASGYPKTLLDDAPGRVDTARSAAIPNWLVAFAGTNGIALARHDPAYEYARLQDYVRARIAAGWDASRIIVCTMLPRAGVAEVARSAYNAAIVTGAATLGYKVARLDLDARIGAPGAESNLDYYRPDGTHPTDAGHEVIARVVADLID